MLDTPHPFVCQDGKVINISREEMPTDNWSSYTSVVNTGTNTNAEISIQVSNRTIYDPNDYRTEWTGEKVYNEIGHVLLPRITFNGPDIITGKNVYGYKGKTVMSWTELQKYVYPIRRETFAIEKVGKLWGLPSQLPKDIIKAYNNDRSKNDKYYGREYRGELVSVTTLTFNDSKVYTRHLSNPLTDPIVTIHHR